jgi:hypothetical protein
MSDPNIHGLPEEVVQYLADYVNHKTKGAPAPEAKLEDLFVGASMEGVRRALREDGIAEIQNPNGGSSFVMGHTDGNGDFLLTAAVVPRSPGRAEDFLQQVADFSETGNLTRKDQIILRNRVYDAEGLVNNAVNKCAAMVATSGSFKVRRVAGKPGKSGDSRAKELQTLLQFWAENVNSNAEDGVITGGQGIQDFIAQGVRQALIEGDHVARQNWINVKVPSMAGKRFSLPMNLQSFAGEEVEIPDGVGGTGLEFIYWVPSAKVIDALKGSGQDKELKKYLDKLIPNEVKRALIKDGKYLLDPAICMHIKNRGVQRAPYGESMVQAAMSSVAYKRALFALEIVTIENLVNRMLILKIGSDNKDSKYHALEVSQRRATMLQTMLRRAGPAPTIVWAGPDLEAIDVGAHNSVMDIDNRLQMVRTMIQDDLGVPAALLTGEGADGKSSGLAATQGVGAQLMELQNRYAHALTTLGRRIAAVNKYEDVDLVWEFAQSILTNKAETVQVFQQGYQGGTVSTRTLVVDGYNLDYEAELSRQQDDVDNGFKDEVFGPPKAVITSNIAGTENGGGVTGRPPKKPGEKDPRADKETGKTTENK